MNDPKHLLIVAGDPSADGHAAALVKALRERYPGLRITALGGVHLRQSADRFLFSLVGIGGFGFWEPLQKLPQLWKAWSTIKKLFQEDRPDVVIPVDYYGFNIHVARLARRQRIPVAYYISPQVWASRPQRIRRLAKVLNKMLVIFPFEVELYRQAGIPVIFVGHPLLDQIPQPAIPTQSLKIGLLPGSRRDIVQRHLPVLIATAKSLRDIFKQAEFLLFRPEELPEDFYLPWLHETPWIHLIQDRDYAQRKHLALAITVSGTSALENTLLGIPMIVMYKLSPVTYQIARRLIRVPYVAIANILAGKPLVPELLQDDATPEKLARAARILLDNPATSRRMRDELLSLRARLGNGGSSQRAAEEIGELLERCA